MHYRSMHQHKGKREQVKMVILVTWSYEGPFLSDRPSLCEDLSCNFNRGRPIDVVYLEFAKAFGKVPHKRFIQIKINWH